MKTRYPDAARLFALDTSAHQLTVLHDQGVYRHLRFRRPDTGMYWFDLITWPGCLTVHGDMGTYTFARLHDMVEFFTTAGDINPSYWGEKVRSSDTDLQAHSPDLFRQCVTDAFRTYADAHGWPLTQVRDLWESITERVLDSWEFSETDERAAQEAVNQFSWASNVNDEVIPELPAFRFYDTWEWGTRDYRHRFLWCCFAVRWGVNLYRHAIHGAPLLPPLEFPEQQPAVPQTSLTIARQTIVTATPKEGIL